ncbi:MAG: SusC/RagA family protein [Azospira oryzae]|nr:MAG: SusC/RagA family protein [Azospira oryzae]
MNMRKIYSMSGVLVVILMLFSVPLLAQSQRVGGVVTDETGQSVPGVSILEKGTTNGTSSDNDGKYSLNVSGPNAILVFSFIGYTTQEVTVGSRTTIDMPLSLDVKSLEEVVVTGYGIDKRRELTGAVSTVKSKDLTFAPSGNVEQMLQGRVPGVTVISNGQPGTQSQIRVRGFGSFGGNSPLYVVDGVPTNDVSFLNPDDIESTTVLKDAASASIYGARAASGVIVYTTKKAKKGQKLAVTYDGMYGFTNPGKGQDMMNPQDFADWTWNAIRNTETRNAAEANNGAGRPVNYAQAFADFKHPQFGTGLTPVIPDYLLANGLPGQSAASVNLATEQAKYNNDPRLGSVYQTIRSNREGTDWYAAITRNAPIIRQTLGFSGGGDNHRFYIGLGAQDQKGILKNNGFKRYTVRANSEFDVLKNFRIGENLQFTYRSVLGQNGGGGGSGVANQENDILSAFRMPSIIPVYDEFGGYAGTTAKGFNNPRNPVASRDGQANDFNFNTAAYGNLYAELDIIPGLTLRTSIGGNYGSYTGRGYSRWQYENSENNSAFGFNQYSGYNFGWTFTNTASYKKTFGDHSLEVLAGQEALNTGKGWDSNQSGLNPFSWDPNYVSMSTLATVNPATSGQYKGVNFSSYFANAKYVFREKYIIGAVIRRDGASRFGANNRYGVFPAASVAWRISSESFMQSLSFVTDLKLRGGYGTMGNSNNVDPNNQYSLYGGDRANSSYDITGSNSSATTGFYRTRIGNPNAKWETSVTKNIGIDGVFLNGKLDVIIDFWQKDTKDLLVQLPITAAAGYNASPPSVNVADMVNKGIDLSIGTKGDITQDLKYELTVNGSFLHNEITAVAPGLTYLTTINPGFRGIFPIRNQVGYSISSFYGYKVQGLFASQEEVNAAPKQDGKAPGRFRYEDLNDDGVIDDKDRTYLGSPVPKFTGGVSFTFRYKNFDLGGYAYASIGNKIFNQSKWFTDFYPSFAGAAISNRVKDSWTPDNLGATIPVFESASNFSTNTQSNSFYVENGSYLRMQNITLGYTVPVASLEKMKLTRLRVYASTNNVFTITKYQGLDPSVGGDADTNFGIDVGNYPITRSFTFGVNLGF